MSITAGSVARADDFINKSQRNATYANDAGRVVKLEADGFMRSEFVRRIQDIKIFQAINGATTPQAVEKYANKYAFLAKNTRHGFSGFIKENQSALAILPSHLNSQTADIPTGATTFSVTANAGTDRVLVIFLWYYQTMTVPTGLTWNGIALTKQTDITFGGGSHMMTWTAPIGTSGSNQTFNVTITGGSTAGISVRDHSSLIYDKVNQTTVFTNLDSAGSSGTSVSTPGLLTPFGLMKMLVGSSYGTNAITGTGYTARTAGASTRAGEADGTTGQTFSVTKATSECALVAIALNPASAGQAVVLIEEGIVDGFTGLTTDANYFVDATDGTISTTGTGAYVGKAISTTALLVEKRRMKSRGVGTLGTATGSLVVDCGFTPSTIRIFANSGITTSMSSMEAIWQRGIGIVGTSVLYNEATAGQHDTNPRVYDAGAGNYMTFSISALTDRGFTIDFTETGTFTGGAFAWEAEE